jgi:putative DNA primase/helicase
MLAEERIKALTGGDRITAKKLYQEPFEFDPTHLLNLFTNHKPIVRGGDNGIWRRLKLIPWEVTITPDREDKGLPERLRAELPGILAWCLEGWQRYQAEGLQAPSKVQSATASYRAESDIIGTFLDDCCLIGPASRVTSTALYREYEHWCHDNGERPIAQRTLTNKLRERGIDPHRGSGGTRELLGLGLLEQRTKERNYRDSTDGF